MKGRTPYNRSDVSPVDPESLPSTVLTNEKIQIKKRQYIINLLNTPQMEAFFDDVKELNLPWHMMGRDNRTMLNKD